MDQTLSQGILTVKKLESADSNARGSHTSTLFQHYIITIGGNEDQHAPCLVDDIEILDLQKGTLQSVKPTNGILPARFDHSACLFQDNKIIIFGGYNEDSLNETIILTITNTEPFSIEWKKIETQGSEKIHRYGHTANIYKGYMYVFGGMDQTEKSSNQLWKLDLNTSAWTLCQVSGDLPGERNGHSSVVYKDKLYIFGGFSFQKSMYMNDLWVLDLESLKWQQLNPAGTLPEARMEAPAQEKDGRIYIFGGLQENKSINDLFAYDIGKNAWGKIAVGEKSPEPRGAHTMVRHENSFIIWGGFDMAYTGLPSIYFLNLSEKI